VSSRFQEGLCAIQENDHLRKGKDHQEGDSGQPGLPSGVQEEVVQNPADAENGAGIRANPGFLAPDRESRRPGLLET